MNVEELEELERTARNAERDADNLVAAVDMLSDAAFFEDDFETVVDLAAAAVREAKHAISEAHAVIEEALSEAEDEDEAEEEEDEEHAESEAPRSTTNTGRA